MRRAAARSIEVVVDGVRRPRWGLQRFCARVLRAAGYVTWDVSVLLCGDARMAGLNGRYRGRKGPTDVLSFPRDDSPVAGSVCGDLAISLDTLRRNAAAYGCTEEEELKRLMVHGLLHLAGMDHGLRGAGGPMLALQERLLRELGGERVPGEGRR